MNARGHGSRERRKLDVDLGRADLRDAVGAEQVDYYAARAPWFDDCYECVGDYDHGPERNAAWRAEMDRLEAAMGRAGLRGRCVELGAGTGYWTERIAPLVDRVTAIDAAPEMLDVARTRLGGNEAVELRLADLWRWEPVERWDAAAALFFIEHVPDAVLPDLLDTLHDALVPGSPFFVAEGAWQMPEPNVETRDIGGREYRVVERRRTTEEFEAAFDAAGFDVAVGGSEWFVDLVATRR